MKMKPKKSSKATSGKSKLNGKANGHAKAPVTFADDPELKAKLEAAGASPSSASDEVLDASPAAESVAPPPKMPPRTRNLRCYLTDEEHAAVAASLATSHEKIDDLDAKIEALGEQAKILKKERDVLEAQASAQARAYRGRSTFRDVECKERPALKDPEDLHSLEGIETIRLDTGERVDFRERTTAEKQGSLFTEDEASAT